MNRSRQASFNKSPVGSRRPSAEQQRRPSADWHDHEVEHNTGWMDFVTVRTRGILGGRAERLLMVGETTFSLHDEAIDRQTEERALSDILSCAQDGPTLWLSLSGRLLRLAITFSSEERAANCKEMLAPGGRVALLGAAAAETLAANHEKVAETEAAANELRAEAAASAAFAKQLAADVDDSREAAKTATLHARRHDERHLPAPFSPAATAAPIAETERLRHRRARLDHDRHVRYRHARVLQHGRL